MPFILIIFGLLAIVVGVRGTWREFLDLLKGDFAGANNFFFWLVAIVAIGALGYLPRVRPISDALLVLVILVIFLAHKGFFSQFQNVVKSTETATVSDSSTAYNANNGAFPALLPGIGDAANLGGFFLGE